MAISQKLVFSASFSCATGSASAVQRKMVETRSEGQIPRFGLPGTRHAWHPLSRVAAIMSIWDMGLRAHARSYVLPPLRGYSECEKCRQHFWLRPKAVLRGIRAPCIHVRERPAPTAGWSRNVANTGCNFGCGTAELRRVSLARRRRI